ncbi:UBX domain-containing protein 10 [Rhodotorula kratochvilovae]
MDPAPLSPTQRAALEQLSAVTARSADPASDEGRGSVELLRRSGWDVETAISRIYDGDRAPAAAPHAYPPAQDDHDDDGVDDALLPARRRRSGGTGGLGTGAVGLYYLRQALAVPLTILALPASLIYNLGALLLGLIARLFRLRGSTTTLRPRNPFAHRPPRSILSPAAAAEQWVQSVEEATGLQRRPDGGAAAASSSGVHAGPSSSSSLGLAARRTSAPAPPGTGPRLPRFLVTSYDGALRAARDEKRVLMVVLSSAENERDQRFKREVLADEEVNRLLEQEDVLVWGGDVGERDAYQVGQTLSYVALPFIAFIALQPSAPSTNPSTASTSSPRLRLLTRLEPSPSAPLTATSLHTHLLTAVLPRAKPFLARLRAQDAQRQADRAAREDAERRVNALARRDEEKVLAVRRREEERRRAEADAAARAVREEAERVERERRAALARRWRAWKRAELARAGEGGDVRVAVRLGDGRRATRGFASGQGTEEVYGWVECELGAVEDAREGGAEEEQEDGPPPGWEQRFHFRLSTTFPRQVIPLPAHLASSSSGDAAGAQQVTVGEAFAGLGKTVNLVVDGLEERRRMSMSSREEGSSDEEEEDEEE